ncbi:MAG: hypothetical protein QG622_1555 [Actinomycetota bacterium]|nr:hypothetical protein [Actinomycetota bacterium]
MIGVLALTFVLNTAEHYVKEGRSVLAPRGERLFGPLVRLVTPLVRRGTAWWAPRQEVVGRLVARGRDLDVAVLRWIMARFGVTWPATVFVTQTERPDAETPFPAETAQAGMATGGIRTLSRAPRRLTVGGRPPRLRSRRVAVSSRPTETGPFPARAPVPTGPVAVRTITGPLQVRVPAS